MEWILFDKDGTLIEFDHSWENWRTPGKIVSWTHFL